MRQVSLQVLAAALLLVSLVHGLPHEDGDPMTMNMDMEKGTNDGNIMSEPGEDWPLSYFAYSEHVGAILAHIILMVVAWCFILPIAVMFSVAKSRYTIPTQFLFLIVNALGLLFGIVYNTSTPDLYENNAHHKIGWIATWVVVAQVIVGLIYTYSGQGRATNNTGYKRATFLPVSTQNMMEHQHSYPSGPIHEYRWSGDSGQGTERNSASLQSSPSNADDHNDHFTKPEGEEEDAEPLPLAEGWLRSSILDRFFAARIPGLVSSRALRVLRLVYNIIDRVILPFGSIAVATGGVTYGGVFRANSVFSGLAHFIKGGIFFWYGLVVLGRFMGCWANFGWSWNIKPTKSRVPTGEFVESALIFTYGSTNVFLEHLAAWGDAWTATDLEHVSISVMFFGAGLCGMLVESKRVREWLNRGILGSSNVDRYSQRDATWETPRNVSLNPMPALIIFLLGSMMGSHHQETIISTMIHKQWGTLLAGAALARAVTYVLIYVKPPTSYLPSRPPSELVGAFCLISGGLVFMLSAMDIVKVMISYELDVMFTFNIAIGVTCFIMAYEILVIAIKAWAVKKEAPHQPQAPSWLPAV